MNLKNHSAWEIELNAEELENAYPELFFKYLKDFAKDNPHLLSADDLKMGFFKACEDNRVRFPITVSTKPFKCKPHAKWTTHKRQAYNPK